MSQGGISLPLCRAIAQMAQPSTHRLRPLRFGTYITKKTLYFVGKAGPMSFQDTLFQKLNRRHSKGNTKLIRQKNLMPYS